MGKTKRKCVNKKTGERKITGENKVFNRKEEGVDKITVKIKKDCDIIAL